jgi:probable HAF family extracellular repeat protein
MKRIFVLAVLLLGVLSFFGCGSGGGGDSSLSVPASENPAGGDTTGGDTTGGDTGGGTTQGGQVGTLADIGDFWNVQGFGNNYYFTSTVDINAKNEVIGYTLGAHLAFVRDPDSGVMTLISSEHAGRSYSDYYQLKDSSSDDIFETTAILKINDMSRVIGNSFAYGAPNSTRGYVYDYSNDRFIDLAPINFLDNAGKRKFKEYTNVADINNAGWVLLTADNDLGKKKCYLWDGDTTVPVNDLQRDNGDPVAPFEVPYYLLGGSIEGEESFAVALNENLVNGTPQFVCNSKGTAFVFDGWDGTSINTFNSSPLIAVAMNNALPVGHVVGNHGAEGFFWDGGETYPISNPNGASVEVIGLNNKDQVIGNSGGQAFIWQLNPDTEQGVFQPLGSLGGGSSTAVAINDNGIVIGYSTTGEVYTEGNISRAIVHAFAWRNGTIYDLGTHVPAYTYPFASNFPFSEAVAINEDNTIVGNSFTINAHHRGFYLTPVFP